MSNKYFLSTYDGGQLLDRERDELVNIRELEGKRIAEIFVPKTRYLMRCRYNHKEKKDRREILKCIAFAITTEDDEFVLVESTERDIFIKKLSEVKARGFVPIGTLVIHQPVSAKRIKYIQLCEKINPKQDPFKADTPYAFDDDLYFHTTATEDIASDIPVGDIPVGDIPVGDIPVGDIPVGDIISTDEEEGDNIL